MEYIGKYTIWYSAKYGCKVIGKVVDMVGRENADMEIVFPERVKRCGGRVILNVETTVRKQGLWSKLEYYDDIAIALLEF